MRRTLFAAVAAAVVALAGAGAALAAAGLERGEEQFLRGEYEAARESLESARSRGEREAALALIRLEARVGNWGEAARAAESLAEDASGELEEGGARDPIAERARALGAEIAWRTGAIEEARETLEPVAARGDLRARYLLGRVYLDGGDVERAEAQFETFIEDWDAGAIDHEDAEALMYVALASRYLASFRDANDTFRDAVALDPELLEANVEWGHLFLEKHDAENAKESFDEVLQINPRHPDAHAGMARVHLERSYDVASASRHIEEALAVDPRHVPALLVRAVLQIDRHEWGAAKDTLDEIAAINPRSLRARALRAAIHWVRGEREAFSAIEAEVLEKNPAYAEFYHVAARSAVREHRYREAIELKERAVEVDPQDYDAMQGIGTGYLRLGQEEEGLSWLRRAWEGDQYNVRTYNTLELFEETIPEEYRFAESEHAVFRYHEEEKPILRRYVEPLVERAYRDMADRYDVELEAPITIELFRDPEDYSVRTTGLPNLRAHAVCFGRVITAVSPTKGSANWAMVLWHEIAHVFAMQISDARVPRWYTEGLSEFETMRARPEWRRGHDAELYAALEAGALPSVAELNHDFMSPHRGEVMVAYHHAALAIEYLEEAYGFDEVVRGLELFGEGLHTPEVIRELTGSSVDEFDAAFREYLRARLSEYEGTFQLPFQSMERVEDLAETAREEPDAPEAHARLGLGHSFGGNERAARDAAERALALDAESPLANFVLGELALRRGDEKEAVGHYESVLEAGAKSFYARARLGHLAAERGDLQRARRHFCRAKRLDPEQSRPYRAMWAIYRREGYEEAALRELEGYVAREPGELAPALRLVRGYADRDAWEKVRKYGELARDIDPSDGELLMTLGEAYLQTDSAGKALYSFESALLVRPEIESPARAHIGAARSLRAQNRRAEARHAAERALEHDPDSGEARALLDALR